jgi:tetratricopeptide (TPR) repeat protein
MTSVSRTIGLAALLAAAPGTAWAGVILSGSYQADGLGRVALSTEGERLVVRATEGGACKLAPRSPVLEGELQGNVLVGRLTVCLRGASCPETETLPLLAFYSPVDHTLTGFVRPREGCQSPMLGRSGLLLLQPAPEPAAAPGPVRPGASLSRLRTEKRDPVAAKQALDTANQLLGAKDWDGAVAEFERSITLDDRSWVAFFALGTVHVKRNRAPEAIEALERARALNKQVPGIAYQLACAHVRLGDKQRAMALLRQAVKLGYAIAESSQQDDELERLLGSEVEFVILTTQAVENYRLAAGRRMQTGP